MNVDILLTKKGSCLLPLNMSFQQQPLLPLDGSVLEQPVLPGRVFPSAACAASECLDVSVLKQSVLPPDVSLLQQSVLPL
jgi:hypothetical protein